MGGGQRASERIRRRTDERTDEFGTKMDVRCVARMRGGHYADRARYVGEHLRYRRGIGAPEICHGTDGRIRGHFGGDGAIYQRVEPNCRKRLATPWKKGADS